MQNYQYKAVILIFKRIALMVLAKKFLNTLRFFYEDNFTWKI